MCHPSGVAACVGWWGLRLSRQESTSPSRHAPEAMRGLGSCPRFAMRAVLHALVAVMIAVFVAMAACFRRSGLL